MYLNLHSCDEQLYLQGKSSKIISCFRMLAPSSGFIDLASGQISAGWCVCVAIWGLN